MQRAESSPGSRRSVDFADDLLERLNQALEGANAAEQSDHSLSESCATPPSLSNPPSLSTTPFVRPTGASAGGPGNKMSRLESKLTKERVARGSHRNLETLKERSYDRYGEDSERNRELRRSMRSARDEVRRRERRRDELGLCEAVTLLPETKLDRSRASAVVFQAKMHDNALQKRRKIMKQGIFTRKKGTN